MSPMLDRAGFERATGRQLASRADYTAALAAALDRSVGFAAGKLGGSERAWLSYPPRLERARRAPRRALALSLAHQSSRHSGIWPTDLDSLLRFCERFRAAVAELDAIGLFSDAFAIEAEIIERLAPPGMPMRFEDQEPVRDPGRPAAQCWLELLRGRRVLIANPFADLLRDRARPEIYEAVWASAGKRWFEPATVASVEFPYGFDSATHARYGSALELLADVSERIEALDFDVALIAAGGLGIPLAAAVKRSGRVGLSLGGHLQVMFGVYGHRWLERREWREEIINDAWIRVPERYRPDPGKALEDYW